MAETTGKVLGADAVARAVERMAEAIAGVAEGSQGLALVGIRTGGIPLAQRLQARLEKTLGREVPLGTLDITLYRDDVRGGLDQPELGPTRIDFQMGGRLLVLVDDVLFTGRTVRAALDQVMDFGRPKRVLLAVLVDRGGRELPIQADVVGERLNVDDGARVEVRLSEVHDEDAVMVLEDEA